MKIPPDWKDNLIDAYIDYGCYNYSDQNDRVVITLKARYIVKKFFGTDGICEKDLYETQDYVKKGCTLKELKGTEGWRRVEVLLKALLDENNKKNPENWRKRATDALVSSSMTEKDLFISDWLEEFKE